MRRLSLIVLCVACQALVLGTGCGGGEDPKPDAGTPPPPVDSGSPPDAGPPDAGPVDLSPPTVVSTSPQDGAVSVPPESLIEVTFSEPMQTSRGTLQIQPGTGLPNGGVWTARPENWNATGTKVTFSAPDGLPLLATLKVTVADFADMAGNPVQGGSYTFTFKVSDGKPPRVTSASPVEGASQVPLTTSEVVFNFNEPMDTLAGTLVPGGGLTLGPASWVGNQVIKAPITSTLVYNGNYSVRLDGFRNTIGKALDGTTYLGDGKLDFGTGPDITAPTVKESSPVDGATEVLPENTSFIVFTFSEPMDKTVGKADLVDGATRSTLTPVWSDDGFNVSYDVRFRLRHDATLSVELIGFKDRNGNALDTGPYLGGALNFTTAPDTTRPTVTSSSPAEGAQDVYPLEVYVTGGSPPTAYRKVFTFQFSEPMDASVTRVTLHEALNPSLFRELDGVWSADRMALTVTIHPVSSDQLPILADHDYFMDLTQLRDPAGNTLDPKLPVLGDGRLQFRTVPNFPLLNHACEHALLVTPTTVSATGTVSASTPRADQIHGRYEVNLPGNGTSFSGYVRMQLTTDLGHHLFLDRDIQVKVIDPNAPGATINVTKEPVRPACAPITHLASFRSTMSPELHVQFGPIAEPKMRFILESSF